MATEVSKLEIIATLEEIQSMTKRNSLEVGFNHSDETKTELLKRLDDISFFCECLIKKFEDE